MFYVITFRDSVCVSACTHASTRVRQTDNYRGTCRRMYMGEGQRTTLGSWFSNSTAGSGDGTRVVRLARQVQKHLPSPLHALHHLYLAYSISHMWMVTAAMLYQRILIRKKFSMGEISSSFRRWLNFKTSRYRDQTITKIHLQSEDKCPCVSGGQRKDSAKWDRTLTELKALFQH